MRYLSLLLAAVLLASCMEPLKDEPFTPPPVYRIWYNRVEDCSGIHGVFDRLRFYVLEDGSGLAGEARGHDVWVQTKYRENAFVVQHEMLHTLIGDGDHTSWRWQVCRLSVESVLAGG